MYLVALAGGIASGKSTVARLLEERGALLLDLDELSHEATGAGAPALRRLELAFGHDVVDGRTGELRRAVLAGRAFSSEARTRELEAIVHPAIQTLLMQQVANIGDDAGLVVVEVPLLDRAEYLLAMADEVVCVTCPLALRRKRAIRRGMEGADFDARVARQTTEEYLVAHADTVFCNDGDERKLRALAEDWLGRRRLLKGCGD